MTEAKFLNLIKRKGVFLTTQQQTALKNIEGPVMLLAVPGSGKTTVLVNRIAYMIFHFVL